MTYIMLFINFVVRYIRLKPLRFILNSLAVASGIALFVSIQLVNEATLISIKNNIDAVAGKSEITITAGSTGFTEQILERVEAAPGVLFAIPMVEDRGAVRSKDGTQTTQLTIFGVDMLKEQNIRSYDTEEEDIIEDPLEFLNQSDSIIITREFANRFGFETEDSFELLTVGGLKKFVVRGIMLATGPAKAFGGSIALMDIDGAQISFGKTGKYDRIDIVTDEEHEPREVVQSLSKELGPAYEVLLSSTRGENLTRVVSSFQRLLLIFASLAWLIGLFLVFSSVNMSVELRRREIGMLRATGSSRSLILFLFVGEGAIIGFVGGALGVLGGSYLASHMLELISNTLSAQLHTVISQPDLNYSVYHAGLVICASVIVAIVAAFRPASKATRAHPLEAIRIDSQLDLASIHFAHKAIKFFLNYGSHFFSWRKWRMAELAVKNLLARLPDVFNNVVVLSLSLFFALFLGATSESMKSSILKSMDQFSSWDLLVSTPGDAYAQEYQAFTEKVGEALYDLLKDDAFSGQGLTARRISTYTINDEVARITALGPLNSRDMGEKFYRILGDEHIEKMKVFFSSNQDIAIISEDLSRRTDKENGDFIEVDTPMGHFSLKIIGVIRDYEFAGGNIYMPRSQFKKIWNDDLISAIGVELTDSSQLENIKNKIDNQAVIKTPLMVTTLAPFVEDVKQKIDEAFMFSVPLQMVAFFVAFLGILSTLIVKAMARMRELGSLRALGMDKNQLIKMLLIEGVLQAKLSLFIVTMSIPLIWFWVRFLLPEVMSWVVDFYFPWVSLGFVYLCGITLALVSSYIPARRVARENIGSAIRFE